MIPELGQIALIIALGMSIVQGVLPLVGAQFGYRGWVALARPAARVQTLFMTFAFGCLLYAFLTNDFSVKYVATNYIAKYNIMITGISSEGVNNQFRG